MFNFFTFIFTLPSKHRKRHNIFQTTLPNNIQTPENSLTNFQVLKGTITTSSLPPLTKQPRSGLISLGSCWKGAKCPWSLGKLRGWGREQHGSILQLADDLQSTQGESLCKGSGFQLVSSNHTRKNKTQDLETIVKKHKIQSHNSRHRC